MPGVGLEAIGIVKRYGSLVADDHIDLSAARCEVHAVMGENGAGKFDFNVDPIWHAVTGRIILCETEVRFRSALDAIARGMGMVHPSFRLFNSLSVWENVSRPAPEKSRDRDDHRRHLAQYTTRSS